MAEPLDALILDLLDRSHHIRGRSQGHERVAHVMSAFACLGGGYRSGFIERRSEAEGALICLTPLGLDRGASAAQELLKLVAGHSSAAFGFGKSAALSLAPSARVFRTARTLSRNAATTRRHASVRALHTPIAARLVRVR